MVKSIKVLEKAYNDKTKFTEKFNLNVINRVNKELNIKLKIKDFKYIASYNKVKKCMENYIISKKEQKFKIYNKEICIKKNEKIQTEISNKFTIRKFKKLAIESGWKSTKFWVDKKKYYAIF